MHKQAIVPYAKKGAELRVKEPQKNRPIHSPLTQSATHDVADAADVNRRIVFSTFVRRRQITGTSFKHFFSFLFPPSRNYATPLLFIRTGENVTNADPKAAEKIYSINQQFFKPQKKKRL